MGYENMRKNDEQDQGIQSSHQRQSVKIKTEQRCHFLLRLLKRINPQAIDLPVSLKKFTWVVVDN